MARTNLVRKLLALACLISGQHLRRDFRVGGDADGTQVRHPPHAVDGGIDAAVVHLKEQRRTAGRPDIAGDAVHGAAVGQPRDVDDGFRRQQLVQLRDEASVSRRWLGDVGQLK